jgi:phosphatidylglycerophosphatase A
MSSNGSSSSPTSLLSRAGEIWATFFGAGLSPKAPGTVGSLFALPLAWLVWLQPPLTGWIITGLVFLTGIWGARQVIARTGETDHQSIVIDEVVGILITTSVASHLWWHYLLAFVLFRVFDISKPWPVSWVDRRWKSATGTMMDDVVAALFSTALLFVILQYFPRITMTITH